MKRAQLFCLPNVFVAVLILSISGPASAQPQAASAAKVVQIRKIEPNSKVATPEYKLLTGQVMSKTRNWFQVNVYYETDPEWMDDLTFTYYIVTQSKTGGQKFTLFRGDVTYVNVQKGKHKSDMYLHPSTIARYGVVQRVGVVISSQGRVLAMESLPANNQRWWEQLTPQDGYVLNRMQTPFAMIYFDDYEAIKPSTAGR
jgi:hypothetical protein